MSLKSRSFPCSPTRTASIVLFVLKAKEKSDFTALIIRVSSVAEKPQPLCSMAAVVQQILTYGINYVAVSLIYPGWLML